jgi:NADP-dependent 3-hydroxy acid dehydrogenase YdfG
MDHAQSAEHARTVVITGASAGIGRATARAFAAVHRAASQHHGVVGAAAFLAGAAMALAASRRCA